MGKKRVLIVDDEEDLTWTLNKKLSKDKDKFDVLLASNGREALELLSQLPIDVVVSDIKMPEINGLDLLLEIKKRYPSTKVIIMTAYGSPEVRSKAIQGGCLYYIEKPFEINELRSMILDALNEKEGFKGTVSDFQLPDIIQLNCLGRLTSALIIRHEGEEGTIYFKNGEIVHAETRDHEGEEAFYQIMAWKGGEFSVKRMMKPPKETIFKSWQNLLLEGLRLADEASNLAVEERENEKKKRIIMAQNELDKLLKIKGTIGVFLFTRGGFPITYSLKEEKFGISVDDMGSKSEELIRKSEEIIKELDPGETINLLFSFKKKLIIVTVLSNQTDYITVIADSSVNEARLRMELRKTIEALEKIFKE
ncbi:MAG: response regulator [Calditrichaeota bacterium]|nr:MAG: response regulator [Calditrichota bacterium]